MLAHPNGQPIRAAVVEKTNVKDCYFFHTMEETRVILLTSVHRSECKSIIAIHPVLLLSFKVSVAILMVTYIVDILHQEHTPRSTFKLHFNHHYEKDTYASSCSHSLAMHYAMSQCEAPLRVPEMLIGSPTWNSVPSIQISGWYLV
ncbi:hypothetical protein A0H81_14778 [Grifola frondosa]|uniref:Uncharacterized protein n=1 Tax=Grifola frondosa TaxID=5627 RepID=A0A1C7LR64_GRIFR|nr:hypothetical protein A0H81_14778 [Grifola frondosa]